MELFNPSFLPGSRDISELSRNLFLYFEISIPWILYINIDTRFVYKNI